MIQKGGSVHALSGWDEQQYTAAVAEQEDTGADKETTNGVEEETEKSCLMTEDGNIVCPLSGSLTIVHWWRHSSRDRDSRSPLTKIHSCWSLVPKSSAEITVPSSAAAPPRQLSIHNTHTTIPACDSSFKTAILPFWFLDNSGLSVTFQFDSSNGMKVE